MAAAPLLQVGFDNGTAQGLYPRGEATGQVTTDVSRSPEHSFAVSGRAATWQGPGRDMTGLLAAGTDYEFSVWARLADGAEPTNINLAMVRIVGGEPAYEWISGPVAGVAGDWVELTGTYSFDEADSLELYVEADTLADFAIDDLVVTGEAPPSGDGVVDTDFEDGLDGWGPRDAGGDPTVSLSDDAHESSRAALVSDRAGQGDGIGLDVSDVFQPGTTYDVSVWVKMAEGSEPGDISTTVRRTTDGAEAYDTVASTTGVTARAWVQVRAPYLMTAADEALLYVETAYPDGTSDPFLVDDVLVTAQPPPVVQDITPIKDTLDPKMGVAVDSRETVGAPAELTTRHFDQLTPENHMKPNAFYDEDRDFRVNPEAVAIMDFAVQEDLDVYGHTLLWYQQTPEWFYERPDGTPLTDSPADQEIARERLRTHIFDVAAALAERWGPYGGGNPIVAFDVTNEAVSDGEAPGGLRQDRWYEILGEQYIDLAFQYADEAFNEANAAPGTDRPVLLAINDYDTESAPKRARMKALVERLLDRGVPVDVVGHQFHVNLTQPVDALDEAIADFTDLPVRQVVSEMDVPTGVPVTEASLIDQGYYFRDAFDIFRSYGDELYSISTWGLTDNRSWLADAGDPLVFDEDLQAKLAYDGIVGNELPPRQRSSLVFATDEPLGLDDPAWDRLPALPIGDDSTFGLRWAEGTLTARVDVVTGADGGEVTFDVDGQPHTVARDGTGDVPAEVAETDTGWRVVAELPLDGGGIGDVVDFDVAVTGGGETVGWNDPGVLGQLTPVETLSYTEAAQAPTAPTIDAQVDEVWQGIPTISTDVLVQGEADGATAEARTLWTPDTLYVLAEVTDDQIDVSSVNAYEQDSVEIFLDVGNAKNGPYRAEDAQLRISAENVQTFGAGDADAQAERLTSETTLTDSGYVVEASIDLLGQGGLGTFHGLDVQVNDGTDGARTSVHTWAEPTGTGYQTTARWGVVQLVEGSGDGGPGDDGCDTTLEDGARGVAIRDEVACLGPDTTVQGTVVIGPGGRLLVTGGTVNGTVIAGRDSGLLALGGNVDGNVLALGAQELSLDGTTVEGNVLSHRGDEVSITAATVEQHLRVGSTTGLLQVVDSTIGRSMVITRNRTDAGPPLIGGNTIARSLLCWQNDPDPVDGDSPNEVGRYDFGDC